MEKNTTNEQRAYIKYQNMLMVAGKGTIVLCAASIIKTLLYLFMDRQFIDELLQQYNIDMSYRVYVGFFSMPILIVFTYLYLRIGIMAIRVAKGERWKLRILILVVALFCFSVYVNIITFKDVMNDRFIENIAGVISDTALNVGFIVMLISTYKLYRYRALHGRE